MSITLTQVGGTFQGWLGAQPGDTLVLEIGYSLGDGDVVTLIDPALVFGPEVSSFDAAGSTETGMAIWSGGAVSLSPIGTGDIGLVPGHPYLADGWEKVAFPPNSASNPCVSGACTSLGTAAFVLSGESGTIASEGMGNQAAPRS